MLPIPMRPLSVVPLVFCCASLFSCGRGGVTLSANDGDVEGVWMPDGSRVSASLDDVVRVEDNRGSYRQRTLSLSPPAAPRSIDWSVERDGRGYLVVDGQSRACRFDFRQSGLDFDLMITSDDGQVTVMFTDGALAGVESPSATAAWSLQVNGAGGYTVAGGSALITKLPDGV